MQSKKSTEFRSLVEKNANEMTVLFNQTVMEANPKNQRTFLPSNMSPIVSQRHVRTRSD